MYAEAIEESQCEAERRIDSMIDFLKLLLNQGYDIDLRGVVRLYSRVIPPHVYVDPNTKERKMADAKRIAKCSIKFPLDF